MFHRRSSHRRPVICNGFVLLPRHVEANTKLIFSEVLCQQEFETVDISVSLTLVIEEDKKYFGQCYVDIGYEDNDIFIFGIRTMLI